MAYRERDELRYEKRGHTAHITLNRPGQMNALNTALREAIKRKAKTKYETDGRPIGLLVFIDGVFHPPRMPACWAQAILEKEGPKERWVSIWLYDAVYDRIIASWYGNEKAAKQAAEADR